MLLKRIEIRDLAGIGKAELIDLDPGLNILIGDNEAGKSTVLTALRAAIFHRHGSGSRFVRDLAHYSRGARPEIDIEFAVAGVDYRLEKRFLQKPEARLLSSSGDLVGDAVEDRLAELFGFSPYSGRGDFETEKHQGAFGLLWVEQGRASNGLDLGSGRDAVAASLEAEVGQILGGDRGRALIAAAKALRDRHWTEKGKTAARSPVDLCEKEIAVLDERLAERRATRRALEDAIDSLADKRRIVALYRRDRVVEAATEAVASADAAERALEGQRRDVTEAEQTLTIAVAARDRAAGEHAQRQTLRQDATEAVEAQATAEARRAEARLALHDENASAAGLEAERATAADDVTTLEDELRIAKRRIRQAEVTDRIGRLSEVISAARSADQRIATARGRLSRGAIDERTLKAIASAEVARREAEIGRDASAAVLVFHPTSGHVAMDEDNAEVGSGTPIRVTRRARFELGGFGAIEIVPDTAAETRDASYRTAAAALERLLRSAGVSSVEIATQLREDTRSAEVEIREGEIEMKALAPKGLGAVEVEHRELTAELARIGASAAPSTSQVRTVLAIDAERLIANERLTVILQRLERARQAGSDAHAAAIRAEVSCEQTAAEATRLSFLLAEQEAVATDSAIDDRLASAEMSRAAQGLVLAKLRDRYNATDPEAIRREVDRARVALAHAARDLAAVEELVRNLEAEIRQTGGLAINEEIDRLEAERGEAVERLERLQEEAAAAKLLYETLRRAEARVRRTWFGPIRREVTPFLQLIHPESEVAFDDATLAITGLSRSGVDEDFKRLSAGAREQVAVVTRLALAQVLKRGGHPAAVILDDALVNTDEKRLKRMHLVLRRAAEGLQIIVLTCRESDFLNIGGKIFRL